MTVYTQQVAPHVLGFIRGALRFGGAPHVIRSALEREFPRLTPAQVDELMDGGKKFERVLS